MTDLPFATAASGSVASARKLILCDYFSAFVTLERSEADKKALRRALVDAAHAGHEIVLTSALVKDPKTLHIFTELMLRHEFPGQNVIGKLTTQDGLVVANNDLPCILKDRIADIYVNDEGSDSVALPSDWYKISCKEFILSGDGKGADRLRAAIGLAPASVTAGPKLSKDLV